jgi:hypothetical protein
MNELLTLVGRTYDDNDKLTNETRREVFCRQESISRSEFYQAQATDLRPELVLILADYLDYEGEHVCIYGGDWYRVIRTYRKGQELELIVQTAPEEEVGVDE